MNGNSQTLELQIKSKAQEAIYSVDKLINEIGIAGNSVDRVTLKTDRNGNKTTQILSTIEKKGQGIYKILQQIDKGGNLSTISTSFNSLKKITDKENISANNLSKTLKNIFTFAGVKKLTVSALSWMNEAIDYTEQLNLFNVVFDNTEKNGKQMFSELGKSALQFQYKLNEAFGTNKTQTLYMQGIFQSMGETVGIKDNYSAIMSETMTKLTYDLASLYNKTENATAEAIRAGVYAGQTKPLRSYGIDVTQSSLQPIAESLGITESVKNMSQAEKEILRYIATLKQAKIAMGDLANTIESPSNQLKVFRQQLIETKTAFSSLFIGALSNALPYANAILMVIKEVSKAIADMFGIELRDYNAGIASQEGLYDGIADSAEDASGAVKELKRQTLGFDEIHNINENNNSGSGTSVNGGIDQRLLDAIQGYDNGMDKVRMKATEIRDRIMEWLGFTKEIDPLTGEVGFKLKDGKTILSNIMNIAKFIWDNALDFFKVIIGYKIIKKITEVWEVLKKFKDAWSMLSLNSNLGLKIALSFVVVEGANLLSKMDFYQDYAKSILGENYNGKDLFGMIGEIFTKTKELKTTWQGISENDSYLLYKYISLYSRAKESNNQNVLDWVTPKLQEYSIPQNFKEYLAEQIYGINKLNIAMEQYNKNKEYFDQVLFGKSIFNNADYVNISDYSNSLQNLFDNIITNIPNLETYNELINQSKISYSNAEEQLAILLAQMDTNQYELTSDDINKLNGYLNEMLTATKTSGQAFTDAITLATLKLQEQGYTSEETAQKVIESAKKKQLAEQGFTEEYISKMSELDRQRREGIITNEAYTKKIIELNKQYAKTSNVAEKAKKSFDIFQNGLKVTGGSIDEFNTAIENMGNAHENAISQIKSGTKESIDMFSELLSNYEEGSEEYKQISQIIMDANSAQAGSIQDVDSAYALALNNILETIVNSKELSDPQVQALVESINSKLSELGYGVDIDVKNNLKNTKEAIEMNGVKIASKLENDIGNIDSKTIPIRDIIEKLKKTLRLEGTKIGSGITADTDSVTRAKSKIEEVLNSSKNILKATFGSFIKFNKNGGVYSNGSWKNIQQYANGGAPTHGSVFVAGEAGAEIVGHINGKTEVLNQSQIASAIYSAVYSAMSQFSGQSSEIDVHVHTDEGTVIDRIEQRTKQTGQFPFTIPTY